MFHNSKFKTRQNIYSIELVIQPHYHEHDVHTDHKSDFMFNRHGRFNFKENKILMHVLLRGETRWIAALYNLDDNTHLCNISNTTLHVVY